MELLEAIRTRRTTNDYFLPDPVKIEHQHLLLEAASRTPSHFNSQPWRFILIEDEAIRQQIADIGRQSSHRQPIAQLAYRHPCQQPAPDGAAV